MLRFLYVPFVTISILQPALAVRAGDGAAAPSTDRIDVAPTDWPWWRGLNRDGIAKADQSPPLHWSENQNVIWKAMLPGRGHGSATVVGNQVFVAAADEEREIQSVLCFDRQTGKQLWKTDVHSGGFTKKENKKSSQASVTVACDGERLFVNFQNAGAIYATALGRDGTQLWQKKISSFVSHQGFGASPAVYKSLVIFSADNKGGGAIAALDRVTGETVWRHDRPKVPNYTSPVILKAAGQEQLIFTGCDLVSSFEPLSGKKLWEATGATTECVTSTVTDGKIVITSGGYPKNHMSAVRADGSGKVEWENATRVYVPSMLMRDGRLYAVTDAGVAMCWQSDTGKELWKSRLGGTFSASPVMVGEYIFATNEEGQTFVLKPGLESVELVAENKLGDEVFATPTICGGRIYLRVAFHRDGMRQEMLYCLGTGP
jgi:outer membrane protein assembly factor BamB